MKNFPKPQVLSWTTSKIKLRRNLFIPTVFKNLNSIKEKSDRAGANKSDYLIMKSSLMKRIILMHLLSLSAIRNMDKTLLSNFRENMKKIGVLFMLNILKGLRE